MTHQPALVEQLAANLKRNGFRVHYRIVPDLEGATVSTALYALADPGSVVLAASPDEPRARSLLPDVHVAVFGPDRPLESLEQVGVMLEALHVDPDRATSGAMINFITGPSRTADIELTLTRGVHGPKEVHAIFVETP